MRQLLLLILLVFVGRWLMKTIRAAEAARASGANGAGSAGGPRTDRRGPFGARPAQTAPSLAEPVVRCAACGVHAPKSESLFAEGLYFCCADHARRHAARAAR
ncbi:uncharacterized protein B0G57_11410 [Trinickia symbiotica]|uniref:Deaminase n=1 Tax=Trinickia symbiotica TaxID=863227 RepID=A0A2N7WZ40_9BURK|nr:PP0621 family protein [Trinickia symbiotica]PMS34591.1 deaminase [Trinickia symbiotica]PPK43068.1 uncharacterized protein B0G57_11410 [Trinickia symbiotica]